ncbi:MAG TPA: LCP family protein [Candidatus Saccharimonadales bacterium]|nr:LCP family protein [Candidatus Saccharimonadales bacterium]
MQPQPVYESTGINGVSRLVLRGIKQELARRNRARQTNVSTPRTALLARRIPIDMNLPGEESPLHLNEFIKKHKWRKARLIATSGFAIGLVIVITLGGLMFSQNYIKLHKVFRGTATADPLTNPNLLKGQATGRINILLMGRDGGNTKQPDVTNTMVVASIDVVNNNISLISIPNNLWVNDSNGASMVSHVFERGEYSFSGGINPNSSDTQTIDAGFKLADQSISGVLGIPINYNVIINFAGLQQLVDALGGITINVPATLTDPTMAWQNNKQATIVNAGIQNLNGKQTLLYVMSKESTSESAREQRQRAVLSAVFSKIMTTASLANPLTLSNIISSLGSNVASDISMTDAAKLYPLISPINPNSFTSIDLSNSGKNIMNGNMAGQPIVLPSAGLFNYGQIHSYISSSLPNPYLLKENASILILNGTNTPGLATTLSNKLTAKGFNVVGVANAPTSNWSKTTIFNVAGNDTHTLEMLEQSINVTLSHQALSNSIPTDGANFVIIIGNDEASHS